MTYNIVQAVHRNGIYCLSGKPKHLYSPKTYIYMWRTINRQKKNHIKKHKTA